MKLHKFFVHMLSSAVAGTGQRKRGGKGISAYVDGSPSKGRVRKALRPQGTATMAGNPLFGQRRDDVYESIVDKASKLFVVIRQSVVCDLAPSALKASFLDPLHTTLFSEVCFCSLQQCALSFCRSLTVSNVSTLQVFMSLFACSDKHFMTMFYAESAIHALTQKTESMARRAEGLTKCKNEFADLARCL